MKRNSVIFFFGAMSVGIALTWLMRSPQVARSQDLPAPYQKDVAAPPPMPPALVERRQEQLRQFLSTHGVKEAKAQEALSSYFGELQRSRAQVIGSNRVLISLLKTPENGKGATDTQIQGALKEYQDAINEYEKVREASAKKLSQNLDKEWTPRLRALLIGMGALGEPSPILPLWGVPTMVAPVVADAPKTKRETRIPPPQKNTNWNDRNQENAPPKPVTKAANGR